MELVLTLHGLIRWLVLLVGVLGLGCIFARWGGAPGRALGPVFVALLDVQLALGVLIFVLDSESRRESVLHVAVMGVAVAVAHALRRRGKRHPEAGLRFAAANYLLPLALILVGLWTLE